MLFLFVKGIHIVYARSILNAVTPRCSLSPLYRALAPSHNSCAPILCSNEILNCLLLFLSSFSLHALQDCSFAKFFGLLVDTRRVKFSEWSPTSSKFLLCHYENEIDDECYVMFNNLNFSSLVLNLANLYGALCTFIMCIGSMYWIG